MTLDLSALREGAAYRQLWGRLPGNEIWADLLSGTQPGAEMLMLNKSGTMDVVASYASSPNAAPLGLEWTPGALELGVFKAVMTDVVNRVNGSIKGGTADEQLKAKSTFTTSFVRRSAQRGLHPSWQLVKMFTNEFGEHMLNARSESGNVPADIKSAADTLIRNAISKSGVNNAPIYM
nr:MAG: RNA-dependent RNA polymerase [Pygmy goby hantavirus FL16]